MKKKVLTTYANGYIIIIQVIQMHKNGGDKVQYKNLKAEMARANITNEEVSALLGIHRNSLYKKLNGGKFYTDEAVKIWKKYFPKLSLDYLFKRE